MTDWTAEEERVAQSIADMVAEWYFGVGRKHIPMSIIAKRLSRFRSSSWRDVKTDPPPRDGWHILARLPESDTSHIICWADRAKGIRTELCRDDNPAGWRHAWDGYFLGFGNQPTHWMPLPPAPENKP